MTAKYIDDNIEHIESDIEKIQIKPNMYISYIGSKGALHLCKEVINNAIDECINPHSPGSEISIFIDQLNNTIMITDNGRGLPFDKMEVVCSYLQSGSKFYREYGTTSGENGVGLTAVNALSEIFTISSRRYEQESVISWNSGKVVKKTAIKKCKSKDNGTSILFKPSTKFLGEHCDIPIGELQDWIEKISFLVTNDLVIKFNVDVIGSEGNISKKYKNKRGIEDYIKKLDNHFIADNVRLSKTVEMSEKVRGENVRRDIFIDVVFNYSSNRNEEISDSFCNYINTIDKGVHYEAVRQALCYTLTKKTKEILTERESKKLDIIFNDCYPGLVIVINLLTTMQPHFASQTKEKLSNEELFKPIRRLVSDGLDEYFRNNPSELKKICDHIKGNAKARIASQEVRATVIKGEASNLDEHRMKNFVPANNGRGEYKELFIIEGDSAAGSGRSARDTNTQALFSLRGVPKNSFKKEDLTDILQNEEFKNLVKVLGCNIGDKFQLNKLKYEKIIIMADSDIDGFRISSLVSAFFLFHLSDIVESGKLYTAVSPLYATKDKKNPFILNKREFIKVFEGKIKNSINILDCHSKKKLNKTEIEELLLVNRLYLEELRRLASYFSTHPDLIEFIIFHRKDKNFRNLLKNKFNEMKVSDNLISGIHEGKYQNIMLDVTFEKRIEDLEDIIKQNKDIYYIVEENDGVKFINRGKMSIGELMNLCQKFTPQIETRFKGLDLVPLYSNIH